MRTKLISRIREVLNQIVNKDSRISHEEKVAYQILLSELRARQQIHSCL